VKSGSYVLDIVICCNTLATNRNIETLQDQVGILS
jgi:hypothetical protein